MDNLIYQFPLPNDRNKTGWPWTVISSIKKKKIYPKITIVTPSKNQGEYLETTIRSILLQNYPNLEYIIIDGDSCDNSVEIIKKYEKWITYWVSEPDDGQTHAINKGFKIASGEIINWINSDDLLAKDALFHVAQSFHTYPSATFIYGQPLMLLGEHLKLRNIISSPFPKLEYLASFPFTQQACFYKTSVFHKIGYLDETFQVTMDRDFFVRLALHFNFQQVDFTFGIFRVQEEAKTYTYSPQWDRERRLVFSQLLRSLNTPPKILHQLEQLDVYIPGKKRYSITKEIPSSDLLKIISLFIRDSFFLNFYAGNHNQSYRLGKWLKKKSPDLLPTSFSSLWWRNKIYRFPILFYLSRPFQWIFQRVMI